MASQCDLLRPSDQTWSIIQAGLERAIAELRKQFPNISVGEVPLTNEDFVYAVICEGQSAVRFRINEDPELTFLMQFYLELGQSHVRSVSTIMVSLIKTAMKGVGELNVTEQ